VGARFSAPVQTGPGAQPASYTMGTGSLHGVKQPGRGVDHPLRSSTEVRRIITVIPLLPLWTVVAYSRMNFTFTFICIYVQTYACMCVCVYITSVPTPYGRIPSHWEDQALNVIRKTCNIVLNHTKQMRCVGKRSRCFKHYIRWRVRLILVFKGVIEGPLGAWCSVVVEALRY
jgi:hypothetical protein